MLSAGERATLDAAVQRIVHDAPDDLTARIEAQLAALPPHKSHEVRQGLRLFGSRAAALVTVRRPVPFHALSPAQQDRMLHAWGVSGLPQARTLYQLLRRLTLATHYSDSRTYTAIGYRGPLHTREPAVAWEGPAPMRDVRADVEEPVLRAPATWERNPPVRPVPTGILSGASLRADEVHTADAIVIGSGVGGAVAAARLAEAGKRVIILESGAYVPPSELTEEEAALTARLFAEGGLRATDDLAVAMLQGASVGGGSVVNWMIMLRTPAHVLDEWADHFGLDGMRAAEMAPVFERIEREVHAARVPDDAHSANNRILLDGAAALGWRAESAVINARGCVRAGFCNIGCRYDAKQGALQTFLPRAFAHGASLYTQTRADRITVRAARSASAGSTKSVTAVVHDPETGHPVGERTFEAPVVLLAGGAVETPILLQRSGLADGGVGRFLRLHPTTAVIGIHDREVYGAAGIPLSAMCDEFIQRDSQGYGFWLECPPLHPALGAAVLPGFGDTHSALMRQFPHLAATIALVRDGSDRHRSNGSVHLDRQGRTRISYALGPSDSENMVAAITAAARLQLAAGAREVRTLHTTPVMVRREADLAEIARHPVGPNQLTVLSAHVNGTCRIGTDPRISGVTPDGQRHGSPGIYVVDGSILPTGVGVNPQETIMAMSSVITERLLQRWPAA